MRSLIRNIFRNRVRRRWLTGLAAVGLAVAGWLSVAHVASDENGSRVRGLRAAAGKARPVQSSDVGRASGSIDDAIQIARVRREKLKQVAGYTAVFSKTEFVNRRLVSQTMDIKFREQPF